MVNSKGRVMIMLGANMEGSDKDSLLITRKSTDPRYFKLVISLTIQYEANKRPCITNQDFEKQFVGLDKKMFCC